MFRPFMVLAPLLALFLVVTARAEDAAAPPAPAGPARYIHLEPAFVVNYGSSGRMRYLRTNVVLRVSTVEEAARVSLHKPFIRNNLVMLFSAQESDVMNTPQGRESLRKVALDEVRAVMEMLEGTPDVADLYFSNFVVQN